MNRANGFTSPRHGTAAPKRRMAKRRIATTMVTIAMVLIAAAGILAYASLSSAHRMGGSWAMTAQGDHKSSATGLDVEFERRIELAHSAATDAGQSWRINSGWRSAQSQQALFDDAVYQYGSAEEASRWVLPPDLSAHVQGTAVDIGPPATAAWLESEGWRFGLCRAYVNEPWHFEPLAEPGERCPALAPDASVLTK